MHLNDISDIERDHGRLCAEAFRQHIEEEQDHEAAMAEALEEKDADFERACARYEAAMQHKAEDVIGYYDSLGPHQPTA